VIFKAVIVYVYATFRYKVGYKFLQWFLCILPVPSKTEDLASCTISCSLPAPPVFTQFLCVCPHFAVSQFQSEFSTSRFPVALLCYLLKYGSANTVKAEPQIPILLVLQR